MSKDTSSRGDRKTTRDNHDFVTATRQVSGAFSSLSILMLLSTEEFTKNRVGIDTDFEVVQIDFATIPLRTILSILCSLVAT